jgi:hypothetical protein
VPVIIGGLGDALKFIGTVAGGIINVIGAVVNGIKSALNFAIDGINKLIDVYNATIGRLPGTPDVSRITKPSFATPATPSISAPNIPAPSFTGGGGGGGGSVSGGTTGGGGGSSTTTRDTQRENASAKAVAEVIADLRPNLPMSIAEIRARESGDVINYGVSSLGGLDVARVRAGEERSITINVNAPSVIDEEAFQRTVVNALNEAANRGTGGGGGIRTSAQVL